MAISVYMRSGTHTSAIFHPQRSHLRNVVEHHIVVDQPRVGRLSPIASPCKTVQGDMVYIGFTTDNGGDVGLLVEPRMVG